MVRFYHFLVLIICLSNKLSNFHKTLFANNLTIGKIKNATRAIINIKINNKPNQGSREVFPVIFILGLRGKRKSAIFVANIATTEDTTIK